MYINMSVYYDITGTSRICQMPMYCRYLQGSVLLEQSPRRNVGRPGLAPELSTTPGLVGDTPAAQRGAG